jgi:hypothetical protein
MANYNIVQGDAFLTSYLYQTASSVPINLSGGYLVFEVRDEPGGSLVCSTSSIGPIPASGSISNGTLTVSSASSGSVTVVISGSSTNNFNVPRSAFQARFTNSSGNATTFEKGWFNVDPGVIS